MGNYKAIYLELSMHWKIKSKIQNIISLFPTPVSYATYYFVQRHFGGLRTVKPVPTLEAGVETWAEILALGYEPKGKVFFEVGTGRLAIIPVAMWLMGAKKVVTIDLNPYMKAEVTQAFLSYMSAYPEQVKQIFGALLDITRFNALLELAKKPTFSLSGFLNCCQIEYIAPGDAAASGLADNCIDFHISHNVLEHIPPDVLKQVFLEGNRIIADGGLFIHKIDYSDHFSHSDKSISAINFLQYSDAEWDAYAGNKFMYMNRLRHDDYLAMFSDVGHHIIKNVPYVDERSLVELKACTYPLSDRFKSKSQKMLSITNSFIISSKCS